jgi:hypothetical protein
MKESEIITKIAEVQAKQSQNKVEQASNKDNSDKLGEEMARLKKELAEAKKPKLKDGDYGETGTCRWVRVAGKVYWLDSTQKTPSDLRDSHFLEDISGNLTDDLTALQEDVTEFEIKSEGRLPVKGELKGSEVWMSQNYEKENKHIIIDKDLLDDFILNLQKMQATLKRGKK